MSKNKTVLSFHESLLKESDVDLLRGPYWLNDTIISFYFEYLEYVKYKDEKKLLFISPQVTQCLKFLDNDGVKEIFNSLEMNDKEFIFFVLNDNESADDSGGFHWSLVVYSRIENTFFHFDSLAPHNYEQAQLLHSNFAHLFGGEGGCGLTTVDTPKQRNGYDCGIHVLCNVDVIVEHILIHKKIVPNCPKIQIASVIKKRNDIISLINSLI